MKVAVRGKLSSLSVLIWVLFNKSRIKRQIRGWAAGEASRRDDNRRWEGEKRQRDFRLHQSENRAVFFCFIRQREVSIIRLCKVEREEHVCVCAHSLPDSVCWEHCKCRGNGCQRMTAINGPLVLLSALTHTFSYLSSHTCTVSNIMSYCKGFLC